MARIPPRALSSGSGLAVEKRDAIPEQISSVRLQEQSALAYRKFRFGADPQKAWRFLFGPVVMISRQPFERRPFLASVTNKLPFILASCRELDGPKVTKLLLSLVAISRE